MVKDDKSFTLFLRSLFHIDDELSHVQGMHNFTFLAYIFSVYKTWDSKQENKQKNDKLRNGYTDNRTDIEVTRTTKLEYYILTILRGIIMYWKLYLREKITEGWTNIIWQGWSTKTRETERFFVLIIPLMSIFLHWAKVCFIQVISIVSEVTLVVLLVLALIIDENQTHLLTSHDSVFDLIICLTKEAWALPNHRRDGFR